MGTGGTSPFGAYGYNPAGIRVGQDGSRHRRAVKVWDKREFKDLDDSVELQTRNMKMALRRLRMLTREGQRDELDLDKTPSYQVQAIGRSETQYLPYLFHQSEAQPVFFVSKASHSFPLVM